MGSLNDSTLEEHVPALRTALHDGWRKLRQSERWSQFTWAFEALSKLGFYEDGELRGIIPNPAYDNAAREICGELRLAAALRGLSFVDDTPGDWRTSVESTAGNVDVREFILRVYAEGRPVGKLRLTFPHTHDNFDMPESPNLYIG